MKLRMTRDFVWCPVYLLFSTYITCGVGVLLCVVGMQYLVKLPHGHLSHRRDMVDRRGSYQRDMADVTYRRELIMEIWRIEGELINEIQRTDGELIKIWRTKGRLVN